MKVSHYNKNRYLQTAQLIQLGLTSRKPSTNSIPSNFTVRENVTSFRKYVLNKVKTVQRSLNYKFV